jgi:frataxin-like iron-binding protein CyaY
VEIISRKFNEIEVDFFLENSLYINATKIGREFGKKPVDWLKTKETKDYLEAFSKLKNTVVDELIIIKKGGNQKKEQGTWIHKKLIISFARWLDPYFAVWCDEVIEEILSTGSYSLQKEEKSKYSEMISETKEVLQLIDLMKDLSPKEIFYLQKIMGENSPTKLLGNSFQNSYFLPTEIGKMSGQTGAEINLILEKKGFQFRDENGVWRPTSSGKEFCLEIGNAYNQLKWKLETIL